MNTRRLLFPRDIPDYIRQDPLRSTECSVYDNLERNLPHEFAIFYSRPWFGISASGEEIDGEADFVIAHREFGILILEVKGGGISFDPATDKWHSKDRYEITHSIKNPVSQARKNKYHILELLKNSRLWIPRHVRARHGMVLPDSARWERDLGADMPLSIFAFEEDVPRLSRWVELRMGTREQLYGPELALGEDGLAALTALLAQPFHLRTSLGKVVALEERDIFALTDQQFQLLEGFSETHRLAITGGAGTGKTLLAVEKACRLASEGTNTLLVCFSRPLALFLRKATHRIANLAVMTFHELCAQSTANLPGGTRELRENPESLAETLSDAVKTGYGKFDAIIVDEAQDFHPSWWEPLRLCLKEPENGILYVFHDSRQRLQPWRTGSGIGIASPPYRLTRNLRNTREIFQVAYPWFDDSFTVPAGPHGHPVEWHDLNPSADAREVVSRYVEGLVSTGRLKPDQIAVLVYPESEVDLLVEGGRLGRFSAQRAGESTQGALTLDSIRRFKGLESAVVIVLLRSPAVPESELLYVALTRARSHLAIFAHADVNNALRKALEDSARK